MGGHLRIINDLASSRKRGAQWSARIFHVMLPMSNKLDTGLAVELCKL
jgi:hypothetical protein